MRPAHEVLVVEDEGIVVESVKRILVPEGFSVKAVGSSEEATPLLQRDRFGIILVDIVLPGVSGLQLTEFLRKSYPEAITITFSGLATRENVVESFRCGAFDFIPKPFSFEELLGAVQRAVGVLERSAGGAAPPGAGRESAAAPPLPPEEAWRDHFFLGDHIWTRFEDDGSAVIGVDESFGEALAEIETAEFPGAFEEIKQGHTCVRITTKEKLVHVVWSALSGVVVESNTGIARGEPSRGSTGTAYHGTWLVRVWPQERAEEVRNLKTFAQR
jgi:CheY-like chemotaxis protein/glycine cleavage system H lipoate-binding protein